MLMNDHASAADVQNRVAGRLMVEVEVKLGLRAQFEGHLLHRGGRAGECDAVPQAGDRPVHVPEGDERDPLPERLQDRPETLVSGKLDRALEKAVLVEWRLREEAAQPLAAVVVARAARTGTRSARSTGAMFSYSASLPSGLSSSAI
jgi:hypothetical protein